MDHHRVKDEDRVLEFDGDLLSTATSQRADSERWVTFQLYRTRAGVYVVSRTGFSLVYHADGCPKLRKKLSGAPVATLSPQALPCDVCRPEADLDQANDLIYPEQPIYWAVACGTPAEVINSLSKKDASNISYITHVARALIRSAALSDPDLHDAYFTEKVG